MKIKVKAPAKINLYLDILDKRKDGYHNVNMIMQSVSLYDTVTVAQTNENKINISSNFNFSGEKINNTAYIAAAEFFKYTGIKNSGISIDLEKKIPLCAGLAGGSTDAAGVLLALNAIFRTNLSKCDLANIGKKVGADVPFCIFGGTMISKGTGTLLSSLSYMPDCFIVLVKPKILVSTQRAYAKSDESTVSPAKSMSEITYAVKSKNLGMISRCMYNKFERVLRINEVYNIKELLRKGGALGASMSGSGPSVFGIFKDQKAARQSAYMLQKKYSDVFLCEPTKKGCYIENEN